MKRNYVEEVRTNPEVYCADFCVETYCAKHVDNIDISKPYIFAHMKGSKYCIAEDEEDAEK